MTKKELMINAHRMAKEIKNQYPEVDYKFQLGLCMSYLLTEKKEEVITWEIIEKACIKAVDDLGMDNYYINNWAKGDMDRSYIEFRYYNKRGLCKKTIKAGYWDNVKNIYVAEDRRYRQYDVVNKIYA